MSLAAVPAYLWARSIVSKRAAVLVAALTLALPALAYSGLLMTETVFYPLLVLVCWIAALTLVAPTRRNQLLLVGLVAAAVLTRLQAGVLVLVFPTAALLAGVGLRALPRRFAIAFLGFGGIIAAWLIWRLSEGGGALGAYTAAASGGYHLISIIRFVFYHGGDLVLLTGFFPACAAALLWFERRGLSAEARAALSVATALSLWLVLQVGVFASHYVGHLAERDMIAAAPPLFLCLAVWLELGAPRTIRRTLLVSGVALVAVLAWPLHTLLAPAALPDAAGLIPIHRLGHQRLLLDGGLLLAALVLILAPRRVLRAVPYVLIALLGAGSVIGRAVRGDAGAPLAADDARAASGLDRRLREGPDGSAVRRQAPVACGLGVAVLEPQARRRVRAPRREADRAGAGRYVALSNSGTVLVAGRALPQRYAVAELGLLANGTPIADAGTSPGGIVAPWRLWQLDGPLTLAGRAVGSSERGHLPECDRPRLQLPRHVATDAPRQAGRADRALPAGKPLPTPEREARHEPIKELHLVVPSMPSAQGPCNFMIRSTGLLGSTWSRSSPRSDVRHQVVPRPWRPSSSRASLTVFTPAEFDRAQRYRAPWSETSAVDGRKTPRSSRWSEAERPASAAACDEVVGQLLQRPARGGRGRPGAPVAGAPAPRAPSSRARAAAARSRSRSEPREGDTLSASSTRPSEASRAADTTSS